MRGEQFWKLEHCSNEVLLSQLDRIMSSGRRLTAELVAHMTGYARRGSSSPSEASAMTC